MKKQSQTERRPMAIGLTLRNFRAFRDSGEFDLAPLTCLVGTNSSGKSSIITALLLLKQSLEQERISSRVTPLMLSGPYCDLGSFRDVVFAHKARSAISFLFKVPMNLLQDSEPKAARSPIVNLDVPSSYLHNPRFYPGAYFGTRASLPVTHSVTIALSFVTDAPFGPSLSKITFGVENIGSAVFLRTTGGQRRQHWRTYTHDLPSKSVYMRFLRHRFFPQIEKRREVYARSASRTKERINSHHRPR